MTDRAAHWDALYSRLAPAAASWHQSAPATSLRLFRLLGCTTADAVVDIGCGDGVLVQTLVSMGYRDVTALDISAQALALAQRRCGSATLFVPTNVLECDPGRRFDVWHDRAVLHFMTEPRERAAYRRVLWRALRPGGAVVLGVFATDGPPSRSGLPVERYDPDTLAAVLGRGFETIAVERELHHTPSGVDQAFTWLAARRRR